MKLQIFLLSLYLVFPVILNGMDTESDFVETPVPGLYVSSLMHDFGNVYWGSTVSTEFVVFNNTGAPVTLTRIRSDCGCRVVLERDVPIDPGESQNITVMYEPVNHLGQFSKTITFYTDRSDGTGLFHWFELGITGSTTSIFEFDPWHVFFSRVISGQSSKTTVTVRQSQDDCFSVQEVTSGSDHLSVMLEHLPDTDSKMWHLTFTLHETAPAGAFSETVTVKTDHPVQQYIHLSVYAWVRSKISISPTQFYLGTLQAGESVERSLQYEISGETSKLPPPELISAPEWLEYTIETVTDHKAYKIHFTVTVPDNITGRLSGVIIVDTDDESKPRFEIPVFGYILSEEIQPSVPTPLIPDTFSDNNHAESSSLDS